MKKIILVLSLILCVTGVRADTCGPGYYYNDSNECVVCQANHYCTGDGTMQPCPAFTYNDISEVYPMVVGYNVHSINMARLASSWLYGGGYMTNIERCALVLYYVEVDQGMMRVYILTYSEQRGGYYNFAASLWSRANDGYYLSGGAASDFSWYRGISACTNTQPANSHYSGPGTPNGNDCPWACDSGYGQTANGECLALCTAGITELHVGDYVFNLYATKQTSPALHVKYNDTICYVSLATGTGTNAMHIKTSDGTIYHTVN